MISIRRGQVDSSVIVGIVVVLAIVSAAGFSIYYFGFVKPKRAELEETKNSALQQLDDTLAKVDTSQASAATQDYRNQIRTAGSMNEVLSITREMTTLYNRESKREELLNEAKDATTGSFHTLDDLQQDLISTIKGKSTLSQLNALKSTITEEANNAWRDFHLSVINSIYENNIVAVKKDSPLAEEHLGKDAARELVQDESWEVLQQYKFKNFNSFEVPIIDTFDRTPTIVEGSRVDIYEYDYENGTMERRVKNAQVLKIIYPRSTLASISWSKSEGGGTPSSYSTNIWEEIKAANSPDNPSNAFSSWDEWAKDVIKDARDANLGSYPLEAIYIVKIAEDEVGKTLMQIEQYETSKKDVVLIKRNE